MPMNYGPCQGGPFNNKRLADHRGVFRIAIDEQTRKAVLALQASDKPWIRFGEYHFKDGVWIWKD